MAIENIIALLGALAGLLAILVSWRTARASAKKDEVDALRGIIAELRQSIAQLTKENEQLRQRVTELEKENARLRKRLSRSG